MPRLTDPLHPNTYYEDDEQVQFVVTIRRRGIKDGTPCDLPLDGPSGRRANDHRKTQVGLLRGAVMAVADDRNMNVAISGRRGP